MSNLYCTPADLQARPGAHSLQSEALLLDFCEITSRVIDDFTGRFFFTKTDTRIFDVCNGDRLPVDDFISVTAMNTDPNLDNTFSEGPWVEDTDFYSVPTNTFPKFAVDPTPLGSFRFTRGKRQAQIAGEFGYGDGTSDPWELQAATGTVADATIKAITLSATGAVIAGQTIKLGTEQLFVEGVVTTVATCIRGVNGTTPAAQAGVAISIAQYPANIRRTAIQLAIELFDEARINGTLQNERTGDYSYQRWASGEQANRFIQMLGAYRKI